MAPIARVPYVTSHSLQHQPKNGKCHDAHSISWYKYSLQVNITVLSIRFCISIISKTSKLELFKTRFANLSQRSSFDFGETQPHMHQATSVSCETAPLSGLVVIYHWRDVDECKDSGNKSTFIVAQHTESVMLQVASCGHHTNARDDGKTS